MSSNSGFSTMSSGEVPSLPKSLPSSREDTVEVGSGSGYAYVPLRDFLDRFSLPRVVRVETGPARPVLLYKQQQRSFQVTATLLIHRYRHEIKVGPEIIIPEDYPGWFSVISSNGITDGAKIYRKIESIVRAGVPAFLLAAPLRAYILMDSRMGNNGNLRAHYTKTTIRAGEVLRLIAIFQDARLRGSMSFSTTSNSSELNQYARCLDRHGHEVFASLSARGEFYAVCQKSSSSSAVSDLNQNNDAVLYKVHQLTRRQLPLRVRLIAGPLPVSLPREYDGLMQLKSSLCGPIVLGCLIPETPVYSPEMLELLISGKGAPKVRKTRLGYSTEARLLSSPKIQRLLSTCSQAMGYRATEPRVVQQELHSNKNELKEMHLEKIKTKLENKSILQRLREGLENLTKPVAVNVSSGHSNLNVNNSNHNSRVDNTASFFGRINKLRQANRSCNPAKKSASFTFASRPTITMKTTTHDAIVQHKYSSLESSKQQITAIKQTVQHAISTRVLEVPIAVELQSDYSHVRDNIALLPLPPSTRIQTIQSQTPITAAKSDEIYAEICEDSATLPSNCSGSEVMARIKILVKEERPRFPSHHKRTEPLINIDRNGDRIDTPIVTQGKNIYNTIF